MVPDEIYDSHACVTESVRKSTLVDDLTFEGAVVP
jgi:hypothetical protein